MAKKTGHIIVQATVSIPRAGEFRVGIPIAEDLFLDPPRADELLTAVAADVHDRLRVKLDKGEHKRFLKHAKSKS